MGLSIPSIRTAFSKRLLRCLFNRLKQNNLYSCKWQAAVMAACHFFAVKTLPIMDIPADDLFLKYADTVSETHITHRRYLYASLLFSSYFRRDLCYLHHLQLRHGQHSLCTYVCCFERCVPVLCLHDLEEEQRQPGVTKWIAQNFSP